eukprot:7448135-Alexandrium_andersonii.AAC.1
MPPRVLRAQGAGTVAARLLLQTCQVARRPTTCSFRRCRFRGCYGRGFRRVRHRRCHSPRPRCSAHSSVAEAAQAQPWPSRPRRAD